MASPGQPTGTTPRKVALVDSAAAAANNAVAVSATTKHFIFIVRERTILTAGKWGGRGLDFWWKEQHRVGSLQADRLTA